MVNNTDYGLRKDVDELSKTVNRLDESSVYSITSNVPIITYSDDVFSPASITFNSYKIQSKLIALYPATLNVYESADGMNYNLVKSVEEKTGVTYVPESTNTRYVKCEQLTDDGYVLDSQSVAIINADELEAGYTVVLGNEAHTLSADNRGLISETQNITIPFYVFKGTNLINSNVSNYTNLPSGMSVTSITACTVSNPGGIHLRVTNGATLGGVSQGVINFSFTTDTDDIIKVFSWSKSNKGSDGLNGVDGEGIEFIFKRSSELKTPTTPVCPYSDNRSQCVPAGWTNEQSGISSEYPFEYVSKRTKNENGIWSSFESPRLWATHSEDGEDFVFDNINKSQLVDTINNLNGINVDFLGGLNKNQFLQSNVDITTIANTSGGTGNIYIQQIGPLIICLIDGWTGTASPGTWVDLGNNTSVPSGTAPVRHIYGVNLEGGRVRVNSNGKIQFMDANLTSYRVYCTIIYVITPPLRNSSFINVTTNPNNLVSGDYIKFRLDDSSGNSLKNTPVTMSINGVNYVIQTDSEGVAMKRLNLDAVDNNGTTPRIINVGCTFTGNNVNASTGINYMFSLYKTTLQESSLNEIVVLQGDEAKIPARINGTKLMPNLEMEIILNGKSYERKTDENGYAYIKMNLAEGLYDVTYKFNRNKINNYEINGKIRVSKVIIG
ncbi:hypothetical protein [Methanobrevibacter sp. DSM 116169]|uniref:hypothetical protein n=1 Tax=Methanobrevibacter sp. DSM 116169 TaxID=3242727 RepID=UPI0038FD390A